MKISSYSKYKGSDGVCVTKYKPVKWQGECYTVLSPFSKLMLDYKKGNITKEIYLKRYKEEVLSKLDANKVYDDLKDKVILTSDDDMFCFKYMIAQWIEEETGHKVVEL